MSKRTKDPSNEELLSYFKQCLNRGEGVAKRPRSIGKINESYVYGDCDGNTEKATTLAAAWVDADGQPTTRIAAVQPLMTTWASLLAEDRRTAAAYPASDSVEDVYNAAVAQKLIDFVVSENEASEKIHKMVQRAFIDGTGALKLWYDVADERLRWSPCSIHDFLIDHSAKDNWRDASWVIFASPYSEEDIEDMWKDNKLDGFCPKETEYVNEAGEKCWGVMAHEFWVRPSKRFPSGAYALIVAGQVVERTAYPLLREDDSGKVTSLLPLVIMHCRPVASVYGRTPCTDLVPIARDINELAQLRMKMLRVTSQPHMLLPEAIRESIDITQVNVIGFTPSNTEAVPDGVKEIKWIQAPTISPEIARERDYKMGLMSQIVGLNGIVSGQQTRNVSGKAVQGLINLDSSKNADASKSLGNAVIAAYRVSLAIMQLFYPPERLAAICGCEPDEVDGFEMADIDGVDVRLVESSEIERRPDVQQQLAEENTQKPRAQNAVGTVEAVEAAKRSPEYAAKKRAARVLVRSYLAGEDVDVTGVDDVALEAAVADALAVATSKGRKADYADLVLLRKAVAKIAEGELETAPKETP